MTAPDAPAGSEHYREGWRDGYDQARIDRERATSAALAGTTTPTADEIREKAASRLRAMAPNHRTAIAGVLNGIADWMSYAGLHDDVAEKQRALSSARALLASTPTTEETDR